MIKYSKIPRGTEEGKMQINLLKFLKCRCREEKRRRRFITQLKILFILIILQAHASCYAAKLPTHFSKNNNFQEMAFLNLNIYLCMRDMLHVLSC